MMIYKHFWRPIKIDSTNSTPHEFKSKKDEKNKTNLSFMFWKQPILVICCFSAALYISTIESTKVQSNSTSGHNSHVRRPDRAFMKTQNKVSPEWKDFSLFWEKYIRRTLMRIIIIIFSSEPSMNCLRSFRE